MTQPPLPPPPSTAPFAAPQGQFRCPYCGSTNPPWVQKKVSTGGWIVFAVLLLVCFPLCWIPFVTDGLKEDVRNCSSCGVKLG